MNRSFYVIFNILVFLPFFVFSELRIDITRGNTEPIPIALLKFNFKNNEEKTNFVRHTKCSF